MYSGLLFLITWIRLWAKQISVQYMICVCVGGRRAFFKLTKYGLKKFERWNKKQTDFRNECNFYGPFCNNQNTFSV